MNILEQMLQDGSKHNIPPELLQALYQDQATETKGAMIGRRRPNLNRLPVVTVMARRNNGFTPDGARIEALRLERGLTVREAAEKANLSARLFYFLEANERPNSAARTVARTALVLGTSIEYLLGLTDDRRSMEEVFD